MCNNDNDQSIIIIIDKSYGDVSRRIIQPYNFDFENYKAVDLEKEFTILVNQEEIPLLTRNFYNNRKEYQIDEILISTSLWISDNGQMTNIRFASYIQFHSIKGRTIASCNNAIVVDNVITLSTITVNSASSIIELAVAVSRIVSQIIPVKVDRNFIVKISKILSIEIANKVISIDNYIQFYSFKTMCGYYNWITSFFGMYSNKHYSQYNMYGVMFIFVI